MASNKSHEKELLLYLLDAVDNIRLVDPEDIPNIDLYMDQVTTFMEAHLGSTRRGTDDKVLTKTMINNYTKNHLLPPPEKKKYSKDHILLLILIYYYKNVLSLQDIQALLQPLPGHCRREGADLADIYDEVFRNEMMQMDAVKEDVMSRAERCAQAFPDVVEEERSFFQLFSLISDLTLDVYLKKKIIEKLIDQLL